MLEVWLLNNSLSLFPADETNHSTLPVVVGTFRKIELPLSQLNYLEVSEITLYILHRQEH